MAAMDENDVIASDIPRVRFYEEVFPGVEDLVVVRVDELFDAGAYVSLLEFNGKRGLLLLSELSSRRIRSVGKLLRVGRTEVCSVLRVDHDKGDIDVSKRRVEPEQASLKQRQFANTKMIHGIMHQVASKHRLDPEDLCKNCSGHCLDGTVSMRVHMKLTGSITWER
eukprot:TRINITY_DN34032_c0_g2_i1.p1 TRINITY_DN34032_c0_g2~~TRINITY_DN34032_c0_g2_i1.p1  ORF type:complete len:167 (+),score=13.42 TRINITY_DN34032_c0_g2_i1:44-544(+)